MSFQLSFATFVASKEHFEVFMRRYWLVLLLSGWIGIVSANVVDDATSLFHEQRYQEASLLYKKLADQNPGSSLYQYRYARCLYELGQYEQAIVHFQLSGERYTLRNYYMGVLHELTYRFSEATDYYATYAESIEEEQKRTAIAERIEYCKRMERYLQRVEDVVITDSVITDKEAFLNAYHLSEEAGELAFEDGGVSHTNQRNDRKYSSRKMGDSIAIYATEKLLDQWTEPHRLPYPLNQENCSYPYLMSDGVTMYFASTANSMGGYDLFITRYNHTADTFMNPENIGMPFNSPANDYMMAIDETQGIGWWATDRRQEEGKVIVYSFVYKDEKQYVAPSDSLLREKAQMLVYNTNKEIHAPLITEEKQTITKDSLLFTFAINSKTIYTKESDFQSEKALTLFHELQLTEDSINSMQGRLSDLRQQYRTGDTELRNSISAEILSLEKQLPLQQIHLKQLTLSIREEEYRVTQEVKP